MPYLSLSTIFNCFLLWFIMNRVRVDLLLLVHSWESSVILTFQHSDDTSRGSVVSMLHDKLCQKIIGKIGATFAHRGEWTKKWGRKRLSTSICRNWWKIDPPLHSSDKTTVGFCRRTGSEDDTIRLEGDWHYFFGMLTGLYSSTV